ncbi:hypothetical protein K435DRAFT_876924 [Dendrothele bispora CBS 962.96]|uniref:Uncharacterized protein n=1 Tax=Dendrothele bispora (strain CBS 962.96) TaxID=1314807 RepID=A0A4V4HB67_DENBC|nr:hypothetical protein K435DRAFT_876924 [Dendrothele bispora CBS 962.96]
MPKGRRKYKPVPIEKRKKQGNEGYFLGGPLDLLNSYVEKYRATLGHRGPFWSKFWGDWRSNYPSKLTAEEKKEVEELIVKYNLGGRGQVKERKVETEDEDEDEDAADTVVHIAMYRGK